MKVSLCILTYNRKDILCKLLDDISEIKEIEEVIVVDNASTDGTSDLFAGVYKWVNYIRNNKNIGVGARNTALRKAVGDVIITIDDDIFELCVADINNIIQYFFDNDQVGAVNFQVIDASSGKVCNWVHHCRVEDYADKVFLTYEITEGAVAFQK
jgi:glycosyltransferase involved in cell wall biosynthesis